MTQVNRSRHLLVMQLVSQTGALSGTEEDMHVGPVKRRVAARTTAQGHAMARRVEMDAPKNTSDRLIEMRDHAVRSLLAR